MTRPAHTASTRSTMSRAGADSRASSHQERLITPSSSSSSSASLATASPHSHRHLTPTDEYKHSTRGHRRPAPGHDDELRPRPPPAYPFVLPQQPLGMTIRHYRQPDRPFYFPTPVLNDPIPPPYTQLQRWSDITRRGSQGSNENLANLADLALTASQHSAAYVKPAAPLTPTRPHQLRQNPPGRVTLVRSIQNGRITLPPLSSFDDPPTPLNRAGDIRHWSPPAGTIKESKSRSAPVALDDTLRDPLCHKSQESYERGFLTAAKNTVGTLQSRRDFSLGVEAEADSERDNESRRTSQVSTLSWQSSERSEPPGESSQETSLSFGSSTNQEVCGGGDDQKDTWEGRTEDIRSRKRLRFGEVRGGSPDFLHTCI